MEEVGCVEKKVRKAMFVRYRGYYFSMFCVKNFRSEVRVLQIRTCDLNLKQTHKL